MMICRKKLKMDNLEQKSQEWHLLRSGKFTGSRFAAVLAMSKPTKTNPIPKPLKARDDLIWTIATERIQGYQESGMSSYSLQWGIDAESFAREAYEIKTGEFVDEIAFITHPLLPNFGISPDGLIGVDGGIEIKCPKSPQIHLQRFLNGVPEEYVPQLQGFLWVTGRKWIDFVSYDPNTKEQFKLLIIRVERDEQFIDNLASEVMLAELEVVKLVSQLYLKG